MDITVTGP